MPRPKKPEHVKADHRFCVCLRTETVDQIYRYASLQGEQAGPIVRRALERVFGMLETSSSRGSCYGENRQPSPSTMQFVLTGSRPSHAYGSEAAPSDLGQREE